MREAAEDDNAEGETEGIARGGALGLVVWAAVGLDSGLDAEADAAGAAGRRLPSRSFIAPPIWERRLLLAPIVGGQYTREEVGQGVTSWCDAHSTPCLSRPLDPAAFSGLGIVYIFIARYEMIMNSHTFI